MAASPKIVVIDYHKGNLSSVARGLARAGAEVEVSDDPAALAHADGIVLPGVGSFADAIAYMAESGQAAAAVEADGARWVRGLSVLPGSCTRLVSSRLKVPHVGWDQVHLTEAGRVCPLLEGFAEGANVFFTHSYALAGDVEPADVAGVTHYARNFASAVWRGNVFGCQFHPEKSSAHGHLILENFVRICS